MCFGIHYGEKKIMSTTEFYRQFVHEFESIPFKEILLPLLKKHLPEMKSIQVLDVGSGPGALALWLQQQGSGVLCVDPSEAMIACCLQKGLSCQHIGLEEFESEDRYDLILALSSLIHLPKERWSKELHRLASLLKPGGYFVLSVILGDFEGFLDPTNKGVERYFSFIPENEILRLMEADFCVLEKERVASSKMGQEFLLLAAKRK
jgi:2-polyprenyl-3-methyl-5-hydroxy-6-metoxy-1,4-benzoquinol methylase